jgi:hypothetical protein
MRLVLCNQEHLLDVKQKNSTMRLKFFIPLFVALGICAAAFIFLQSWSAKYADCRKKAPTNKMIWEGFSQQFFSTY